VFTSLHFSGQQSSVPCKLHILHVFAFSILRQLTTISWTAKGKLGSSLLCNCTLHEKGGTRWPSWMRHCATNRKVTDSILDSVTGIFHWHNPFGRTYGPGVDSVANRNEYQEYLLGGKGGRWLGLTTLPSSCADRLEIWESQPPGIFRACPGLWWNCFFLFPSWEFYVSPRETK
jgi:hypothetical protein